MRAKIIRIGNSQGIRIPKLFLQEAELEQDSEVELTMDGNTLIVRPISRPRQGWDQAFSQHKDTGLLDPLLPTQFDETEWVW